MLRHADRDEKGYVDDEYDAPDEDTWDDTGDSTAYWRRRFLILCGGVAALGVCAWLFPGAHHPQARSAAASASMAALAKQQSLPPAAPGSAWQPPSPTPSPSSSPSPTPSASATAKKKISIAYRPPSSASASALASAAKAGTCAPASIVLSLFSSQPSYAAGGQPAFSVYAVSTSATPCTLAYGAGSVQVVVTRHGEVVWDSAACKPAAAKPVRFTRGVPQLLTMTWNRRAAGPAGCAGSLPAGAAGSFDAVAMRSGGQSSPVTTFKIN
jgi:hypothetical protein